MIKITWLTCSYKITYDDIEGVSHTIQTKTDTLEEVHEKCKTLKGVVDKIEHVNPWLIPMDSSNVIPMDSTSGEIFVVRPIFK